MHKIIIPFLFFSHLLIGQSVIDQKLDFKVTNVSIEAALLELSKNSGVDIAFSRNFFKDLPNLSVELNHQSLELILERILAPTNITFKTLGNQVLLFRKKSPFYTISGYVEDQSSGERLIAATVYSPDLEKGAITNEYGFYSLALPPGSTRIYYSYLGYEQEVFEVDLAMDQHKNIRLNQSNTLEEVIVTTASVEPNGYYIPIQGKALALSKEMIAVSPDLGGEADPIRVAQLAPGIQAGAEGSAGIAVRGGDPGQNLMLLDGVPIYIPYHLMGFYSIYNAETVRSVKVYKGNFPARYGGRLSSVFDIRTREGNQQTWSALASANLISNKLLVEGPLKKDKGAVLVTGRSSHAGFILNPFLQRTYFQNTSEDIETSFYDLNTKMNYTFSDQDRLYLSLYQGRDNLEGSSFKLDEEDLEEEEVNLKWSNTIGVLRWNHLFNEKLFSNVTVTFSEHQYEYRVLDQSSQEDEEDPEELTYLDMYSFNTDFGAQFDFDYSLSTSHQFRFGGGISSKSFIPELTYFEIEDLDFDDFENFEIREFDQFRRKNKTTAWESHLYVEDQFNINNKLYVDLGWRWSHFSTNNAHYSRLEPRFSSQYLMSDKWTIRAAVSRMIQYLHLVSFTEVRLPTDLWVPSGENILPQASWQGELGFTYDLFSKTQLLVDAYYKQLNNLYTYPENFEFQEEDFIASLTRGRGTVKGLEVTLSQNSPKSGGMLSYAYTDAQRTFNDLNNGRPFASRLNDPHQIKLFLYHRFKANLSLGLNWIYSSSRPLVNVVPLNTVLDQPDTEINSMASLNDYHRLDISATYRFSTNKLFHTLKIGAYNVYNRENIAYFRIDFEEDNTSFQPISGLPFRPSLSYRIQY